VRRKRRAAGKLVARFTSFAGKLVAGKLVARLTL